MERELVDGVRIYTQNPRQFCASMWDTYGFDYDLASLTDGSVFAWPLESSIDALIERLATDGVKAEKAKRFI